MQAHLPEPSPDALAASNKLQNLIVEEIRRQDGWISFARYMELALYAPDLGYYSGGAVKLGKDGDFTTAPEMTSLFGETIAHAADDLMRQSDAHILEFGAGTGKLAADILTECAAAGITVERYSIVEVSAELRARQQQTLAEFPQVTWLDAFPPAFSGVVVGNEVLDAMPVSLVVKRDGQWLERGVIWNGSCFDYEDRPCSQDMVEQIPDADTLQEGYLTEVHPVAVGFMATLASMLTAGYEQNGKGGAAILFDYGFPNTEFYLNQRHQGTLMCHYRHHSHPDPFYLPGLQDITAHVDFTAMAYAAVRNGLEMLGYMSQAGFLMSAGIADRLLQTSPEDAQRYLPKANAVQKLTSPAEMGELFKVLVVGKEVTLPDCFDRADQSRRL
ncbi:MAG: class I SAM-dependent methyltransferase [Oxalicibacterium faecigallinarum]|uniref:class I SAM-dependent methyltransferase n=1 Tax=Oxalicibacterium faecigallinarum TaxID=573741 RepID=UPI002809D8DE|nr:class I SAM-dependent methyltransferase [Oxalicibacterium faecigallinarum]MDQ7969733.1 class I SAM-dependent methyltransferase [Oxalicibacterium faecigallinarum]